MPQEFLPRSENGLVFPNGKVTALIRGCGLKQEFITPPLPAGANRWPILWLGPQQNGMVERVIRVLKEQHVHRQRGDSIQAAAPAIGDWIGFCNHQPPHQALKMKTPAQAFALAASP